MLFEYFLEDLGRKSVGAAFDFADGVTLFDRFDHVGQVLDFVKFELEVRRKRGSILDWRRENRFAFQ